MAVYAVKFREKGSKKYLSVLLIAEDYDDYREKFKAFAKDDAYDIDLRTVSWAGNSVPFLAGSRPVVIDADLDAIS